jgi:hypothetical protein
MNQPSGETRRIQLDQTSWIEHIPGWLGPDQAEELLAKLIANAAWEQRDRWMASRRVIEPLLTAEYTDLADAPTPRSARQPTPTPPRPWPCAPGRSPCPRFCTRSRTTAAVTRPRCRSVIRLSVPASSHQAMPDMPRAVCGAP